MAELRSSAALLLLLLFFCSSSSSFERELHNRLNMKQNIKPFYGCETSAYPPNNSLAVPHYTIDLALQPNQRWIESVTAHKKQMVALVGHVYNLTEELIGQKAFTFLLTNLEKLTGTLPSLYREEMSGIASASGLPLTEVVLYNIFYELITFCTSIVVQDNNGTLYHGRNLDFGIFMGWNTSTHQWRVAEMLRPLVIQLSWNQGEDTVFSSVNYVGYVGVITAVKKGAFSFSLDERFTWNGGFVGLLEWILFKDHEQKWLSFLTRDVLQNAKSYEEALSMLSKPRLLAPVYFILAGARPGQACIITRSREGYDLMSLQNSSTNSSWFLVQTNYDHWQTPPFFDDRRTPAVDCLNKYKPNAVNQRFDGATKHTYREFDHFHALREKQKQHYEALINNYYESQLSNKEEDNNNGNEVEYAVYDRGDHAFGGDSLIKTQQPAEEYGDASAYSILYNVLSTRPVLNKLTTYTSLMSPSDGRIDTFLRKCDDPCWPW